MRSPAPILLLVASALSLDFRYHGHDEIGRILEDYEKGAPGLRAERYSIGRSTEGRELWVMAVSAAGDAKGVPNVKLVANMHGNEAVGREVLLQFLMYLRDNFGKDPEVTWLLNSTRVHVMPTMNPDGFARSSQVDCGVGFGRESSSGEDLNRNFPDYFAGWPRQLQNETRAVMEWMRKTPFVLSANVHGGALVVSYPFDTVEKQKWEKFLRELMKVWDDSAEADRLREEYLLGSQSPEPPSPTPDNDVFVHLAKVYARNHPKLQRGSDCTDRVFQDGIVNGANWYSMTGSMSDYNYAFHGCYELTLEISCCKYPPETELPQFWDDNRKSLLALLKEAHRGVTGVILDADTLSPVANATLMVRGRKMQFKSAEDGQFWRLLLPKRYTLMVKAEGYHPAEVDFVVQPSGDSFPKLTEISVLLTNSTRQLPTMTTTTQRASSNVRRIPKKQQREERKILMEEAVAEAVHSGASFVTCFLSSILVPAGLLSLLR